MPAGGDHLAGAGAAASRRQKRLRAAQRRVRTRQGGSGGLCGSAGRSGSGGFAAGERVLRDGQEQHAGRRRQQRSQAAADYAKAHPDAKLTLSGFTDATGSAAKNAELAKTRAQAVRDALKAAGVAEDRIILKKPETITGGSRRERSPACRDQSGCLTVVSSASFLLKGSWRSVTPKCRRIRFRRLSCLASDTM